MTRKPSALRILIVTLLLSLGLVLTVVPLRVLALVPIQRNLSLIRITYASDNDRNSFSPALSADGTRVAFESDSDFFGQGIPNDQYEIWLYDTTTMTYTRVTTASASDRESRRADLNADGTRVAFESDSDFFGQGIPENQSEIWLYSTTTMTYTRVTTASASDRDSWRPALSADGTRVAFESDSDFLSQGIPDNQYEIWLYDTTTITYTRVTTASPSGRESLEPALNADGTKVAFTSDSDFFGQGIPDNQYEVWLYDTTTMTYTRVTTASPSGRHSFGPALNADGTKVAFISDSDFFGQGIPDNQYEIWLYDTATMTCTRVTTSLSSLRPDLSADGTKVVFEGVFDVDIRDIWLYDTMTATYTRITIASDSTRSSVDPALSADGKKVAFGSDSDFFRQSIPDNQSEIWLYPGKIYLPIILKNSPQTQGK